MTRSLSRALATIALCLTASTATASDLTLNGQTSVDLPPGASLHVELTGNPGLPAFLAMDLDSGPHTFKGEVFPLGVTPLFTLLDLGLTDGNGLVELSAVMPTSTVWLGIDVYLLGVILDPTDPNGHDLSNSADLIGVPETCTPAVIAACLAAGLEACSSGTPDCGPPIDLCTPAVVAACEASGFCSCDPLTGACQNVLGAGGQCCMPSDLDDCGICFGDGTGLIGCPGNCSNGVGECVCDTCICPAPHFGLSCTCTDQNALYNGQFQHSYIPSTPKTLMAAGSPLSFEGWIKPTKTGSAIATRAGASNIVWGFSVGVLGNTSAPNRLRLYNNDVCATCAFDGNAEIPLNVWTHIAFTWDDTTNQATFFVNGVVDAVGSFAPNPPSLGQLLIGLGNSVAYYGGNMDDLRMWSTVRTPAEILDNYDKGLIGVDPDLVFNHNFQRWTAGNAESVDFTNNHLNLVHSLFVAPQVNVPAPGSVPPEGCANNCNGSGTCSCGVCSCFDTNDLTFDCSG